MSFKCTISNDVFISPEINLILGDCVYIGPRTKIIGKGTVKFGDYSKIHGDCFINVPDHDNIIEFGCNTWIGERTILDGTGNIIASHNIGIGIASQLYSHISHGDILRGCRFNSKTQLTIGKDAWFVGQCLVSPVNIGEKSVALLGSTITKDTKPNSVYAGIPAKDVTEKLGQPWDNPSSQKRLFLFDDYVKTFSLEKKLKINSIVGVTNFNENMDPTISYFNVMTGTYTKRSNQIEIEFMKWLTSYKARFIPNDI